MTSEDGRYVIVYNGEIFNYVELRKELESIGCRFRSRSDTEVLLTAYSTWGEKCLDRLNGMFSFVLYDTVERTIFGARDRFGIKPFYYYHDDRVFIFASEIPAVLSVLPGRAEPDNVSIYDYLVFNRTDQNENTFFRGIKKLQHACSFTLKGSDLRIKKWYDLREKSVEPFTDHDEYLDLFKDAASIRLRSDVPVGGCLSGGLDSSSIVSVLVKYFGREDLATFSAIYGEGITGDESPYINEYKSLLGNMHYCSPDAGSLIQDKEKFVRAHGEPVPSTAPYAHFKVMELAQNNVVVTLDGQGADEQLAGYHYFFGFYFKELLRQVRWIRLMRESAGYLKTHRSLYGIKTLGYFMLPGNLKNRARVLEKNYLDGDFVREYGGQNTIASSLYASDGLQDALFNHFDYKLEHLLKWEDRNSMWFSLESRVPFLDYRLVEKTLALPAGQIINRGQTKYILRQSMKGILPEAVRTRTDKIGFLTPEDSWFRTPVFEQYVKDLVRSESFRERGFFDTKKVEARYSAHLSGRENLSKEIWKWINLELWFRQFIDSPVRSAGKHSMAYHAG